MEKSGTPQGQDQTTKKTDQPQDSGALRNRLPSIGQNPPPPDGSDGATRHANPAPWWKRLNWTLVIESAVFIVAVYVACIYSRQLDQMVESNKINHESLEAVQRAFVIFHHINLDTNRVNLRETERQWVFTVIVENSGTTPAISKIQYFSAGNEFKDQLSEEQFVGAEKNLPIGETGPKAQKGIGPIIKTDIFILGTYPLASIGTKEFMDFIRSKRIFLWGWVGYRDVFPGTRPHVTEFCEEVIGIGAGIPGMATPPAKIDPAKLQPRVNFQECEQHNCTDDHCKDYQTIAALVPK